MTDIQHLFVRFVEERERIRQRRAAKHPAPWTHDPLLRDYRFCNVNREHDAVTIWVAEHVRNKAKELKWTLAEAVAQIHFARTFNEPPVLADVGLLSATPAATVRRLEKLVACGRKILRGAYLVVPNGSANRGRSPQDYFPHVSHALRSALKRHRDTDKLEDVADAMMTVSGIGEFMANQVITDLRYTTILHRGIACSGTSRWSDWTTFVLAGPGTRRGLNRYMGAEGGLPSGRKFPKMTGDCAPLLLDIRSALAPRFSTEVNQHFRDPNNLSNCFCEFDKYCRGRHQILTGQRVTLRQRNQSVF